MNNTFLQQVAEDLDDYLDGHFEQLTIVVPNKRTRLFLDPLFAQYAQPGKPRWAPRYVTITELFASLSSLQPADELLSVTLLHQAYTKALHSDESLEHFYAWGQTLLADFDDMDNQLVDVERLLCNLQDLEQLTATKYLSPQQVEAVKQFFTHFHEGHLTQMKQLYQQLWQQLLPIYRQLHNNLLQRGLAYPGMLKREVVSKLPEVDEKARAASGSYAFVGFHLLSKSEQALFSYLKKNYNTFTFDDQPDNLDTPPANLTVIQAPTDNAQARYAGPWLEQLQQQEVPLDCRTAIVLCDEHLLLPLLHSLPSDPGLAYNVSMGFPLDQTPVSTFISALLELQLHGFAHGDTLRLQQVATILQHPYTALLFPDANPVEHLAKLRKKRIFFPSLQHCPAKLKPLFSKQEKAASLLHWLLTLLEQPTDADGDDPLLAEALFAVHTLLTRLAALIADHTLDLSPTLLARLILTLLRRTTIPLSGEPADGIQILGLLETRNLAFDNLLVLGANEGNLPRRTISHSFIPYPLREAYGMSTHEQANDLYKYYFYRLLAHAKHTTVLYNATPASLKGGEPSRFVLQLLTNGKPQLRSLQSPMQPLSSPPLCIPKSNDILDILRKRYTGEKAYILSPSAINTFIDCSLKFYFQYVARIRMPESLEEEVPANTFGTIFHAVMQHIYTHIFPIGTLLTADDLNALSEDTATLQPIVFKAFENEIKATQRRYTGEQALNCAMILSYVQRQLKTDAQLCPLVIHAAESGQRDDNGGGDGQPMETCLLYVDTLGDDILLGGIIDRRDTITLDGQQVMRIVDYKTSANPHTARDVDALFNANGSQRPYHFLQAFYYAEIYATNHPDEPVAPAIAYVKKDCDPVIHIGKEPITDFNTWEGRDLFVQRLDETLNRLFSPDEPFQPTSNDHTCEYCDFALLCGRSKAGRHG